MLNNFKLNKFFLKYETMCLSGHISGVEKIKQNMSNIIKDGKPFDEQ